MPPSAQSPNSMLIVSQTPTMRFIDLFAGLGGFRVALERLGHECVFASEIDVQLQEVYAMNFPDGPAIQGDIRQAKDDVPEHDILCAGFPCQPFSKSGAQAGLKDQTIGTLYHEIRAIIEARRPSYVILENVGNFERHDGGRTWQIVKSSLMDLGYWVQATEHVASGGDGLLSPHHLGYPHHRERFFAVASLEELPSSPFPTRNRQASTSMAGVVQTADDLSRHDFEETAISEQRKRCIEHWNSFLGSLPEERVTLPSFPIWGDEFGATYAYEGITPWAEATNGANGSTATSDAKESAFIAFDQLPSYARTAEKQFPRWKERFIKSNRTWLSEIRDELPQGWVSELQSFPPSLRKLEWNCQGEERDLWKHILQFRPSGLRVKRYANCPSLVAMTGTQIPILGPERRHLSRVEGLRLQGFQDDFSVPESREATFKALGNAVHVDVVERIARRIFGECQEKTQCRSEGIQSSLLVQGCQCSPGGEQKT